MKRSTAVDHIVRIAEDCAGMRGSMLEVPELVSVWAFGKVLDVDARWTDADHFVSCAIAVDLPELRLPWLAPPEEVVALGRLVRWDKRPVAPLWRSARAPVWNHRIVRPLRVWSHDGGSDDDAIAALRERVGLDEHRETAPTAEELADRLQREVEASLVALRGAVDTYDDKRWSRERTMPYADALFEAAYGYCDLLTVLEGPGI